MQKTKQLKTCKILMMVCALMLVFGSVIAVNDGVEANVSILATSVTYEKGDGPKPEEVTLSKETDDWNVGDDDNNKLADAPKCTNNDFEFMGWMEKDKPNSKLYKAGDPYKITMGAEDAKPKTFIAVWGVKVTFDKNLDDATENITVPPEVVTQYKKDFSIDEQLEATDYSFLGWSTEAKKSDAEPEYKYGAVIDGDSVTGAIKLYAIWKANFLSVTYHANTGNDTTDSSVTVPVDSTKYKGENLTVTIMGNGKLATDNPNAATMKDATPARSGYTFAGWATTEKATKVEYKPGDKIDAITKDMDLYAVWTNSTATSANTASGSGTSATTSKTPQTGDSDHFTLYIVMAVLSMVGIAYLCYDQKKAKVTK